MSSIIQLAQFVSLAGSLDIEGAACGHLDAGSSTSGCGLDGELSDDVIDKAAVESISVLFGRVHVGLVMHTRWLCWLNANSFVASSALVVVPLVMCNQSHTISSIINMCVQVINEGLAPLLTITLQYLLLVQLATGNPQMASLKLIYELGFFV